MHKMISLSPINHAFSCMYNNTIKSFFNAMWFFIKESYPPTLLIKLPVTLFDSSINLQTKAKLMVGIGMFTTCVQMAIKFSFGFSEQKFQTMFNINSVIVNLFFTGLILEGALTKVNAFSCVPKELDAINKGEFKRAMSIHLLAELLMLSSTVVGVFSFLDLVDIERNKQSNILADNIGLIKASSLLVGHVLMSGQQHFQAQLSDNTNQVFANQIKSLWYENENNNYVFLTNYRNAALSSNLIFLAYAISTTLQNCRGPKGPNGDRSCISDVPIEKVLFFIQLMCNLWIAESFLKKGVDQVNNEYNFNQFQCSSVRLQALGNCFQRPNCYNSKVIPDNNMVCIEESKENLDEIV